MEAAPLGFLHLSDALEAPERTIVSVMGVICDFQPAVPTQGPDWQMTIQLKDPTCYGNMTFRIKLFNKEDNLPTNVSVGDVLMVRSAKISSYQGSKGSLSTWDTCTVVFLANQIPAPEFKLEYAAGLKRLLCRSKGRGSHEPTVQEQFYVIALRQWSLTDFLQGALHSMRSDPPVSRSRPRGDLHSGPSSRRGDRFSLIKDVGANQFSDLVVEVVKVFGNPYNTLDIYVSDYTSNNLLCDYAWPDAADSENLGTEEHEYNDFYGQRKKTWLGPYGRLTLQIKVWEPHSHWMRDHTNEGDVVLIRNVHTKYVVSNVNQLLAGALHQDRNRPMQVDVSKAPLTDPRVKQLFARKADYTGDLRKRMGQTSRKSKKKRQEAPESKKNPRSLNRSETNTSIESVSGSAPTSSSVDKLETPRMRSLNVYQGNPNVNCSHLEVPVCSLKDLCNVDRSFIIKDETYHWNYTNQRVHVRVRVLDYFPNKLEDFSQFFEDIDEQRDDVMKSGKWEWAFYLRVEDANVSSSATQPVTIFVGGHEAVHLLKMDACDLTQNSRKLAELRERLFILWGNAEELKNAGMTLPTPEHSSKPFDCCIQEYGVLSPGETDWSRAQRQFGIFGTTIQT